MSVQVKLTEEMVQAHAEVCKKHKHAIVAWDDPKLLRAGWHCKTCRIVWYCSSRPKGAE